MKNIERKCMKSTICRNLFVPEIEILTAKEKFPYDTRKAIKLDKLCIKKYIIDTKSATREASG